MDMTTYNVKRQTPIEIALQIDQEGTTTSILLYGHLKFNPANYSRWCKINIEDNPFAIEGVDYWLLLPEDEREVSGFLANQQRKNYKLSTDFAKKLCMLSKSPQGEEAREYFISVEQNAKQFANGADNLAHLIKNDPIMALRLDQIQQAQRLAKVEEETNEVKVQVSFAEEQATLAHQRIDSLDKVDPFGDPRQQLVNLVTKYAQRNGLHYSQAWDNFRQSYNTAFRTNIKLKITHYAKIHNGGKKMTTPEYLEITGQIEDGLRVAQKMLNMSTSPFNLV